MSNLSSLWDDMYGGMEKTAAKCCSHKGCPPNKCLKKGKGMASDEPDPEGEESPEAEAAEDEEKVAPSSKASGVTFRELMARAEGSKKTAALDKGKVMAAAAAAANKAGPGALKAPKGGKKDAKGAGC